MRKLFQIKEKWATAHIPTVFTGGVTTSARAEAMNSLIKHAMASKFTLVNLFLEILKIEQGVIRSSREVINPHDVA